MDHTFNAIYLLVSILCGAVTGYMSWRSISRTPMTAEQAQRSFFGFGVGAAGFLGWSLFFTWFDAIGIAFQIFLWETYLPVLTLLWQRLRTVTPPGGQTADRVPHG